MFYLEDEKTLVLTNENKKDILNALTKINQVSNNKNIKVAYIKKEPSKRKALTIAWQRSSLTGRKPNYIRR